jgi:hypothetical protein
MSIVMSTVVGTGAHQTVDPRLLHFIALVELVVRALGHACTKKSGSVFNEKLHDFVQSRSCPLYRILNEETSNTKTYANLAIWGLTDLIEGLDIGLLAHFQKGGSKIHASEREGTIIIKYIVIISIVH